MLIPREHGAYGQLGFPLLAALAAGRPSAAAAALAVGFVAAFLAHEPLLVLAGLRGPRARREHGRAAVRDGTWMTGLAVSGVAAGLAWMPPTLRWSALIPIVLGLAIPLLVLRRIEKTTGGEMFVALTLTACALPVAVAAGVAPYGAAAIWAVTAMGYCAATAAVRGTIARQRREPEGALRAGGAALALAAPWAAFLFARSTGLPAWLWTATVPLSVLSLALAIAAPPARHLRAIGWALIATSAAAAVLLSVLVRA